MLYVEACDGCGATGVDQDGRCEDCGKDRRPPECDVCRERHIVEMGCPTEAVRALVEQLKQSRAAYKDRLRMAGVDPNRPQLYLWSHRFPPTYACRCLGHTTSLNGVCIFCGGATPDSLHYLTLNPFTITTNPDGTGG